ncbi:MAG: hypothetical protein ACOX4P_06565 [Anaerovoracaceae bacterium]|jgi:uncharacterized protein YceK
MKRKSIILMVLLIISIAITGCGGNDKNTVKTDGSTATKDTAMQEKESLENGKTGMDLPEDFPKDIIPVLDDARIDHIIRNDVNKAININYNTDKSKEEAIEFYKEVMKDGKSTQEMDSDDSYIIFGVKGNYAVSITILAPQGDTIVNIDTRPEA